MRRTQIIGAAHKLQREAYEQSSLFFCMAEFRDRPKHHMKHHSLRQPLFAIKPVLPAPCGAVRRVTLLEQLPKVTAPSFLHVAPKYYYLRLVVPLIVINFVWAQPGNLVWCEKRTVQVCGPWRQALSSTGSASGTE